MSNQPQTLEISIAAVLNDPAASHWLKNAVKSSLERDPLADVNYPDRSATTILAGGSGE